MRRKSYLITCSLLFLLIVFFSMAVLLLNNKTVPLAKQVSVLTRQINQLEEDNERLLVEIESGTTLKVVQKKAESLGLKPVQLKKVKHIYLSK